MVKRRRVIRIEVVARRGGGPLGRRPHLHLLLVELPVQRRQLPEVHGRPVRIDKLAQAVLAGGTALVARESRALPLPDVVRTPEFVETEQNCRQGDRDDAGEHGSLLDAHPLDQLLQVGLLHVVKQVVVASLLLLLVLPVVGFVHGLHDLLDLGRVERALVIVVLSEATLGPTFLVVVVMVVVVERAHHFLLFL